MLEQIKCNNDSVVVFTDQQMGLKWAVINRFNNSQLYQHNNGIRRKEKKKKDIIIFFKGTQVAPFRNYYRKRKRVYFRITWLRQHLIICIGQESKQIFME